MYETRGVAKSFLNLTNLGEKVHLTHHWRNMLNKGDFVDENNATIKLDIKKF